MTARLRYGSPVWILPALATVLGWPRLAQAQEPEAAAIALPAAASECVRWAANEVALALRAHRPGGLQAPPVNSIRVLMAPRVQAGSAVSSFPPFAAPAESFSLERSVQGVVTVHGGGETGAMYGLLELAEQVAGLPPAAAWGDLLARLEPVARSPALALRAENAFLHVGRDGQLAAWFHDEEYWRRYLELLARSRFNTLDLHGAYDPATTAFSNLLPLFTAGGAGSLQQANLTMLRRVVALAAARGIRVGILNYEYGGQTADATAQQVEEFLRGCPGLACVGARIKRTGSEAVEKFERSYLQPARAAGFGGMLYTRSWGTDLQTLRRLGRHHRDTASRFADRHNAVFVDGRHRVVVRLIGRQSSHIHLPPVAPSRFHMQRLRGVHRQLAFFGRDLDGDDFWIFGRTERRTGLDPVHERLEFGTLRIDPNPASVRNAAARL